MVRQELINRPTGSDYIHTTFQRRLGIREERAGVITAERLAPTISRAELHERLSAMVGHTPLLRVEDVGGSHILAKVESQNPTESHYDRAFLVTLKRLEKDGIIQPGDELVEVTSGNAGTSFAWLCKRLGYKAHIFAPPTLPAGRVQEMVNFGAVVEKPQSGYMPESVQMLADELERHAGTRVNHYTRDYKVIIFTREDGTKACVVNHSANRLTVDAFHGIGEEVIDVLPDGVDIDFVVSVLGNFTTTTAFAETFKGRFPSAKIIGVEDERNPAQFVKKYPGKFEERYGKTPTFGQHTMYGSSAEGTRLAFERAGKNLLDDIVLVNGWDTERIAREYNIGKALTETIGNSSAASILVARKLAEEYSGSNILIFFYDKADRYGVPVATHSVRFLGSEIQPLDESTAVQPLSWHQERTDSLRSLPRSLREAYDIFGLNKWRRRK